MTAWNSRALSSVSALNKDWLDLITHRLATDAAYSRQVAACESTEEWWRVTSSFFDTASHDYQDQYARFTKISSEIASADAPEAETRDAGSNRQRSSARSH